MIKQKVLNDVIEVAETAGAKLIKYQKKLNSLGIKSKDAQGVVSEADIETEKFLIKNLRKILPESTFLAEEEYFLSFENKKIDSQKYKKEELLWIIDPLDGTTNFLSGMDYFAVAIGLMIKGKMELGLIYRPQTEEYFYSIKGKGAYYKKGKESRPKKLSLAKNNKKLKDSLVVTGFASEKHQHKKSEIELFYEIMKQTRGVRRMGSAALDLVYVAQGIFDGFWEAGLAPWDVAGAALICEEAGVKITNFKGEKFDPFARNFIAARRPLHRSLLKIID